MAQDSFWNYYHSPVGTAASSDDALASAAANYYYFNAFLPMTGMERSPEAYSLSGLGGLDKINGLFYNVPEEAPSQRGLANAWSKYVTGGKEMTDLTGTMMGSGNPWGDAYARLGGGRGDLSGDYYKLIGYGQS